MKKALALIVVSIFIAGCATPASRQEMVSRPTQMSAKSNPALYESIIVREVTGGQQTNPLWTSQVSTEEFKGALIDSLRAHGYGTSDPKAGRISLDAELKALKQPIIGFTFDVTSVVEYRLNYSTGGKVIPITAVGSASVSDAFIGTERLRVANERSIKENIKLFVEKLSGESGR